MININPILEAMGELDDKVLENAYKPKFKKSYAMIAAIAAAFAVLGCSIAIRSGVSFDGREQISFNYYAQSDAHILTAEELQALGATGDNRGYTLSVLPSELFSMYNVTPLMNAELFDEEESVTVTGSSTQAIVSYTITDKETGKPISVKAEFYTAGEASFGANYTTLDGKGEDAFSHYEAIELNDGSKAFVADRYSQLISGYNSQAVLCRDGVGFKVTAKNTDISEMKNILKKLAVCGSD